MVNDVIFVKEDSKDVEKPLEQTYQYQLTNDKQIDNTEIHEIQYEIGEPINEVSIE